ncbi:hypothetical protein BCV72DRAFT_320955 [Rhizopus microsporus var. microsporus]|uniref:Homeodomain-like domain-containing protein n=1 Tax=Rhizopus microsporus var. microsporus TaxID=86635 RepID=A0A1X0QPA1_RHIZD|nr:hypothetical protein BCV72DRAFT_320955 [Rhizopus microsporus var. microsporus]
MGYIIDEERYALETASSYIQYLINFVVASTADEDAKHDVDVCMKEASSKRAYALYTDQDKVRFFKLMFVKVMSASAAAKQLGIHVRTAQRWAQMYKTDADSVFIKHKKTGRSRILHEEHKQVILEYINENPSSRLVQKFQDLKVSKSTVYNFVRTECNLSLKKAQFQSVDRNSEERIQECFDWIHRWEFCVSY